MALHLEQRQFGAKSGNLAGLTLLQRCRGDLDSRTDLSLAHFLARFREHEGMDFQGVGDVLNLDALDLRKLLEPLVMPRRLEALTLACTGREAESA